jgi:hypothetical protein
VDRLTIETPSAHSSAIPTDGIGCFVTIVWYVSFHSKVSCGNIPVSYSANQSRGAFLCVRFLKKNPLFGTKGHLIKIFKSHESLVYQRITQVHKFRSIVFKFARKESPALRLSIHLSCVKRSSPASADASAAMLVRYYFLCTVICIRHNNILHNKTVSKSTDKPRNTTARKSLRIGDDISSSLSINHCRSSAFLERRKT